MKIRRSLGRSLRVKLISGLESRYRNVAATNAANLLAQSANLSLEVQPSRTPSKPFQQQGASSGQTVQLDSPTRPISGRVQLELGFPSGVHHIDGRIGQTLEAIIGRDLSQSRGEFLDLATTMGGRSGDKVRLAKQRPGNPFEKKRLLERERGIGCLVCDPCPTIPSRP